MSHFFIDCRDWPGNVKCSVALSADTKKELLDAINQHGHLFTDLKICLSSKKNATELKEGILPA